MVKYGLCFHWGIYQKLKGTPREAIWFPSDIPLPVPINICALSLVLW